MQRFLATRSNDMLTLSENVRLSTTLNETLDTAEIIVISVNSQGLRDLMKQITDFNVSGKTIVLCMKGIEIETGKRLTEVVREYVDDSTAVARMARSGTCTGILQKQAELYGHRFSMPRDHRTADISVLK